LMPAFANTSRGSMYLPVAPRVRSASLSMGVNPEKRCLSCVFYERIDDPIIHKPLQGCFGDLISPVLKSEQVGHAIKQRM
jgi:hypothetical protein